MKFILLLIAGIAPSILAQNGQLCKTPDNKDGVCVTSKNCQPLIQFIRNVKRLTSYQQAKLQDYQCKLFGAPRVCCPNSPILIPASATASLSSSSSAGNIESHPNLRLLPDGCGVSKFFYRPFSEHKTGLFQFPWMTLLTYQSRQQFQFRCAGSIINTRYILTAAHCITNDLIGIRAGEHTISTSRDCEIEVDSGENVCAPPVQDVNIEERIPHSLFSGNDYDIALLRLATPLNMTGSVQSICLPTVNDLINFNFTGRKLQVLQYEQIKSSASDVLLQARIPVISDEECRSTYSSRNINVIGRHICAGDRQETDSFTGKDGGPLQAVNVFGAGSPGSTLLFGIVSFNPKPRTTQYYGLYTKVGSHMKWILDNLKP